MLLLGGVAQSTLVLDCRRPLGDVLSQMVPRGFVLARHGGDVKATWIRDVLGMPLSRRLDDLPTREVSRLPSDTPASEAVLELERRGHRFCVVSSSDAGDYVLAASEEELRESVGLPGMPDRSGTASVLEASGAVAWQALFEHRAIPDGVRLLDVDVLGDTERLLGSPTEQVLHGASRWLDWIHPEDREACRRGLWRLLAGRVSALSGTVRVVGTDGSWRLLKGVVWSRRIARDRTVVSGLVASAERSTARPALDPRALPGLMDRASDPLVVLDRSGKVLYANRSAKGIFGSSLVEGGSFALPMNHTGRATVDLLAPARKTFEVRADEAAWQGRPAKFVVFRDVTRWVREGRRYKLLYETLFESAPVGLVVCEQESGRILDANASFLGMLGYRSVREMPSAWDLGLPKPPLSAQAGPATRREVELAAPDGRQVPTLVGVARVAGADSSPVLVYSVESLVQFRELQRRTAHVEALATIGTLAAGLAHELNNPLTSLLYSVEELAELVREGTASTGSRAEAASSRFAEAVQDALDATHRILEIARGLGRFSSTRSMELGPVDVNKVVETAARMAWHEVKHRARLVKDLGDVPVILSSEGRLGQVVLNLLVNAAHAIRSGSREDNEVRIRTFREGDWVVIEVSDTGQGIPPENLERIFEPFFTTKELGRGTGLGLAISRSNVESLGGSLTVESQFGQGSRFQVRLPVREVEPQQPAEQGGACDGSQPRARVLVVEEDTAVRRLVERILGAAHDVVAVAGVAEAKALLEQDETFDVVFCAAASRPVPGTELHRWLAERGSDLADRVVFLTAGVPSQEVRDYLSRVENVLLDKPFEASRLRRLAVEFATRTRESK